MAQRVRRDIFGRVDMRTAEQREAYRYSIEEAAEFTRIDEEDSRLEEREFLAEWTAEVTASRRAAWNARQRAGEWRGDTEDALGFDGRDLKRAVAHHAEAN